MMLARCLIVMVAALGLSAGQSADSKADAILKECRNQQSDIYFLLDSSSSLMLRDFLMLKDFVATFVERLDISPQATRVGLGVFADSFYEQFNFDAHDSKSAVVKAIREATYYGGDTYTGRGLQGMRTVGFKEGVVRENATKIGVVVTDGKSRHRTDTLSEAALLQDRGVWLFAIGVGRGVDGEELSTFASDPHAEFLRHVDSFADLSPLTSQLAIAACRLQPPHADNATCGLNQKADILFVFNAATLSTSNLTNIQNFTEDVIQDFSMTSGNVRVGVVSEGRRGEDIALSKYIHREDFVRALKYHPSSELATLLKKVRQQGYDPRFGGRSNAKKFAIIFVDDVNVSIDAIIEARMMTYSDVIVFTIEVGLEGNREMVRRLPSSLEKYFQFGSYAELVNKAPEREKFVKKLCSYL